MGMACSSTSVIEFTIEQTSMVVLLGVPTCTCPLVSIEEVTMIAITAVAAGSVHTEMLTVVATLAFIDICT